MDLTTSLIGFGMIVAVIILFVAMKASNKSKERKRFNEISKIAENYKCKISQLDSCGNFIIGIDEAANYMFFLKKDETQEVEQVINLAEIQSCRIINSGGAINNKSGNYHVINKLALSFTPIVKTKTDIEFEFYNADSDTFMLSDEIQLLEKWKAMANSKLKKN